LATIDLRDFSDTDGFVVHFGGRPNEVDAYTFANALVAFSDAYREINSQLATGQSVEMKLEALGPGSFRSKIKGVPKGLTGFFSKTVELAILPILVTFFYDSYLKSPDKLNIEINDDYVVLEQANGDKIIIPRSAYDASKSLPKPEDVHKHVAKAVTAVESDQSIDNLAIVRNLDDDEHLIDLPRSSWSRIQNYAIAPEQDSRFREMREDVVLSILKAVFTTDKRKWDFVWNGVKISAYIADAVFIAELMDRKYTIGNGDKMRCTLLIEQEWSETDKVWLNSRYSVEKVFDYIPAPQQTGDLFD